MRLLGRACRWEGHVAALQSLPLGLLLTAPRLQGRVLFAGGHAHFRGHWTEGLVEVGVGMREAAGVFVGGFFGLGVVCREEFCSTEVGGAGKDKEEMS